MKYEIKVKNSFKRSFKKCLKRGFDENIFIEAVSILAETGWLPQKYHPHALHGKYEGCMECHLQPDWLLVWKQDNQALVLILVETGTHSDLF